MPLLRPSEREYHKADLTCDLRVAASLYRPDLSGVDWECVRSGASSLIGVAIFASLILTSNIVLVEAVKLRRYGRSVCVVGLIAANIAAMLFEIERAVVSIRLECLFRAGA